MYKGYAGSAVYLSADRVQPLPQRHAPKCILSVLSTLQLVHCPVLSTLQYVPCTSSPLQSTPYCCSPIHPIPLPLYNSLQSPLVLCTSLNQPFFPRFPGLYNLPTNPLLHCPVLYYLPPYPCPVYVTQLSCLVKSAPYLALLSYAVLYYLLPYPWPTFAT